LGILAPHSAQYLIEPLSCDAMPTDLLSIDIPET
jgi:hypothetical protein